MTEDGRNEASLQGRGGEVTKGVLNRLPTASGVNERRRSRI